MTTTTDPADTLIAHLANELQADPSLPRGWAQQYVSRRRAGILVQAQAAGHGPRPVHMLSRNHVCPGCDKPDCRWDAGLTDADLAGYYRFIVGFSGGKDSIALVLYLLERGVPKDKIELWHHDVDGREGSRLVDWPCTRAYCQAFAAALGLRIFFSWKVGGFEGEMLRKDAPTAPTAFEEPQADGSVLVKQVGGKGPLNTRMLFPQVSADLNVRWCSAYLKIEIARTALRNQARFLGQRTVLLTGERSEESANRARYGVFEPHHTDNREGQERARRHIDHWRPVHGWPERYVWEAMERWRVNPHPAYRLGFGRVSCARCIFSDENQWASSAVVDPVAVERMAAYEAQFGKTIHRKLGVLQRVRAGSAYPMEADDLAAARSHQMIGPALIEPWTLPRGAYGDTTGPT